MGDGKEGREESLYGMGAAEMRSAEMRLCPLRRGIGRPKGGAGNMQGGSKSDVAVARRPFFISWGGRTFVRLQNDKHRKAALMASRMGIFGLTEAHGTGGSVLGAGDRPRR